MAAGDDGPDDAMVKIELMTCQLGALDDSGEWMASMVGVSEASTELHKEQHSRSVGLNQRLAEVERDEWGGLSSHRS